MSKKKKKERETIKKDTKKVPNKKSPEAKKSCKPSDTLGKRALVVHGDDPLHTLRAKAASKAMRGKQWQVDIITYSVFYKNKEYLYDPPSHVLSLMLKDLLDKNCEKYAEIHFYLHGNEEGWATFEKNDIFPTPRFGDGKILKGKKINVDAFSQVITKESVIYAHACFSCVRDGFWQALRDEGFDVRGINNYIVYCHETNHDVWEEWDERNLPPPTQPPTRPADHTGHEPWRRPENYCN